MYRYEDDPVIGQRLYREIREIEVKKGKGKSVQPISSSCYQWETVATSLDEFQDVSVSLSCLFLCSLYILLIIGILTFLGLF